MSTMLVTSYPPAWKGLADLTTAVMRKYCDRHGYDFYADCSETSMRLQSPWTHERMTGYIPTRYFVKFALLEHFLTAESCRKAYDTVAWIDVDCVITRPDMALSTWVGDVVTACDVNGMHPTIIIVNNSTLTRGFIWACNNAGRTLFSSHDWADNLAMRFFGDTPPYDGVLRYYSAKEMCAMTPGLYPIPPDVRAMYEWTEDSFSLHLSALPLQRRIEMAKALIEERDLL